MIFAQIKNGVILNTIVLANETNVSLFEDGFDACIRIDTITPHPAIGWTYENEEFSPPEAPTPPSPTLDELIQKAQVFGDELMREFMAENIMLGITQAGKTIAVANYLHKLMHYISTGSLYAVLTEIETLKADTGKDNLSPFVTNDRLEAYAQKVRNYLGI